MIEPGSPLRLLHGLLVHGAAKGPGAIEQEWRRFAAIPFRRFDAGDRPGRQR